MIEEIAVKEGGGPYKVREPFKRMLQSLAFLEDQEGFSFSHFDLFRHYLVLYEEYEKARENRGKSVSANLQILRNQVGHYLIQAELAARKGDARDGFLLVGQQLDLSSYLTSDIFN